MEESEPKRVWLNEESMGEAAMRGMYRWGTSGEFFMFLLELNG
jgi:hypothetical protein